MRLEINYLLKDVIQENEAKHMGVMKIYYEEIGIYWN
jgi:hypothetical protein